MTIYVGNISYQMNEDDLQNVFAEYGNVNSVKIIKDKFTGRSKGFGFIEMAADGEAENAIQKLDGKVINGRNLRVNKALPRNES